MASPKNFASAIVLTEDCFQAKQLFLLNSVEKNEGSNETFWLFYPVTCFLIYEMTLGDR